MGLRGTYLPISWAMSSGSRAKRPPLPPSPPYALGMVNADQDLEPLSKICSSTVETPTNMAENESHDLNIMSQYQKSQKDDETIDMFV